MTLAWRVANLSRAKRMPTLDALLARKHAKPQTPQQLKTAALVLSELYGFKVTRRPRERSH